MATEPLELAGVSRAAVDRRAFLSLAGAAALGTLGPEGPPPPAAEGEAPPEKSVRPGPRPITLFLCGDVMTGRGVDQVLPHPGDPRIHEGWLKSARAYVELAEGVNGAIPAPVDFRYIWGDALAELRQVAPDVRIINLETAVTTSDDFWKGKGIHYRMHPANVPCLTAAEIDCCTLANNHILDWGYAGLAETLQLLERAGVRSAGAGRDTEQAERPVVLEAGKKGRVIVLSLGSETSGIPRSWAASRKRPGVDLLMDLSEDSIRRIARRVGQVKRSGDIVVASIHWGGNWGYEVFPAEQAFAHGLVEHAGVDVVHGHSSHHPKGIEVWNGKPILYGCGDFINDYEGIGGYERYRGELGLMYFVTMDAATGRLEGLRLTPTRMRRFRVSRATGEDSRWLSGMLNREGRELGTAVERNQDGSFAVRWSGPTGNG